MTPFFNPGPNPHGNAKVFLAGVGELMTEVAGEVCDGFLCHGFTTERYLREVTLPALERGRGEGRAGRWTASRSSGPAFVVTGTNEEEMAASADGHAPADRVLRLDARLPRRARAARLGRPAGRAQRAVEAGRVGRDGRRSSTTRSSTRSPWSAEPEQIAPELHAPLRRRDRPHQLLRALQGRPRPLARGASPRSRPPDPPVRPSSSSSSR